MTSPADSEMVRRMVRDGYGRIASGGGCCGFAPPCCGGSAPDVAAFARHMGYSSEELVGLPPGANMGLSCGNPTAIASLAPGEVVLDLGSGGGFDAFIAGPKVGPAGRVIGVDMAPEMLSRARSNIAHYHEATVLDNVEFRLGEIEYLPVSDATIDIVISNCVINLSPDKERVWHEIARVLKPGGRVAVSDLALLKPLPPAVVEMIEALLGCVAGAVLVSATEGMAAGAGLVAVETTRRPEYMERMVDWQDPLYRKIMAHLPPGAKASDHITSLEIRARKPGRKGSRPKQGRSALTCSGKP